MSQLLRWLASPANTLVSLVSLRPQTARSALTHTFCTRPTTPASVNVPQLFPSPHSTMNWSHLLVLYVFSRVKLAHLRLSACPVWSGFWPAVPSASTAEWAPLPMRHWESAWVVLRNALTATALTTALGAMMDSIYTDISASPISAFAHPMGTTLLVVRASPAKCPVSNAISPRPCACLVWLVISSLLLQAA